MQGMPIFDNPYRNARDAHDFRTVHEELTHSMQMMIAKVRIIVLKTAFAMLNER